MATNQNAVSVVSQACSDITSLRRVKAYLATSSNALPDAVTSNELGVIFDRYSTSIVGAAAPNLTSTIGAMNWISGFVIQLTFWMRQTYSSVIRNSFNILGHTPATGTNNVAATSGFNIASIVNYGTVSTDSGILASANTLEACSATITSMMPNAFYMPPDMAGASDDDAIAAFCQRIDGHVADAQLAVSCNHDIDGGPRPTDRFSPKVEFLTNADITQSGLASWTHIMLNESITAAHTADIGDLTANRDSTIPVSLRSTSRPCSAFAGLCQRLGSGAAAGTDLESPALFNVGCQGGFLEYTVRTPARGTWIRVDGATSKTQTAANLSLLKLAGLATTELPKLKCVSGAKTRTSVPICVHSDSDWNYFKGYVMLDIQSAEWAITLDNMNHVTTLSDGNVLLYEVTIDSVIAAGDTSSAFKVGCDLVSNGTWSSDSNEVLTANLSELTYPQGVRDACASLRAYQSYLGGQSFNGPANVMKQVYESLKSSSDSYSISDGHGELITIEWYLVPQDGRSDSTTRKVLSKFVELLPVMLSYMAGDIDYVASLLS